jgi:3-dehydroquinate synthetase
MALQLEHVAFDGHKTPYVYGVDCASDIVDMILELAEGARSALFVVDQRVRAHAESIVDRVSHRMRAWSVVVNADERHKRLSTVENVLHNAIEHHADRSTVVLAMGGGFVGNVAGLAASLLFRGVRLVHLPTTPIAAFDAVLSQKQAVNLGAGKNVCGAYHPPALIACDIRWLTSMPRRELRLGLAEMVKNILAVAPEQEDCFWRAMTDLDARPTDALTELCGLGIGAKAPLLVRDPHEKREALVFEYGHTVGHALELVSNGGMSHGEAIAWGMLVAAEVSLRLGHLAELDVDRHNRLVSCLPLPPARAALDRTDRIALRAVLATDNKRGYAPCSPRDISMVLLAGPGAAVQGPDRRPLVAVPDEIVMASFDQVARGLRGL